MRIKVVLRRAANFARRPSIYLSNDNKQTLKEITLIIIIQL